LGWTAKRIKKIIMKTGFVHVQKGEEAQLKITIGGHDYILVMRKDKSCTTLHIGELNSSDHVDFKIENLCIKEMDDKQFDELWIDAKQIIFKP
jgi:hypothetical protein